jgi:hypothetical protein
MCIDGGVEVLFDALAVKNVVTFCLDGIFCDVIAQSAYGDLHLFVKYSSIAPAADYEVGMTGHLTHARNQSEDIGVVCSCPRVIEHFSSWSTKLTVE